MTELEIPGSERGEEARNRGGGVAAKLRNAFIGVSLFSLLAAVVGIASYQVIERAQDEVIDRSLPAALGAERMAKQVLSVVLATPTLFAATDEELLAREVEQIRLANQELREIVPGLRRLGVSEEQFGLTEADLDTVFANLESQIDLIGARNRLNTQIEQTAELALANAAGLIGILTPGMIEASAALLEKADGIRQALSQPNAVGTGTLDAFEDLVDRDFYEIERLTEMRSRAENIINHVEELELVRLPDRVVSIRDELSFDLRSLSRGALEVQDPSVRENVGRFLQGLSQAVHGPASLIRLKSELIEVNGQLTELEKSNFDLAEILQGEVDRFLAETATLIRVSTEQARSAVALGRIALALIALVAFGVAIFISWRYVLRDVAGRIRRLADITRDLAQGDIDVEVDVAGNDELGEMADAVRVFKANATDLRHTNSELEQFAYVASHDLKAPLRGIANLASWIEQDLEEVMAEGTKQHLTLLQGRIGRMEALLEDLLAYSRVGRDAAELRTVDLEKTVPEIFNLVAPGDRFRLQVNGPLPRFVTAQAPLEQVFRNLIGNAVKHHDADHGWIEIGVRDLGESFEFQIRDDGPGVAIEYQEKILAMFQTLRSRDDVEGSGMGLALVKKIVESAGGAMHVESDPNTKRGMSVRFSWPKNWRGSGTTVRAA